MGKSTKTITHLGSDVVSTVTGGSLNLEKMRFNVPFSGAAIGQLLKSTANIATGEQMRGSTDDFFSSKFMKIFETVAGAVALAVVTAGVASALSPAAVAAEGAAVGAESSGSAAIGAALAEGGGAAGTGGLSAAAQAAGSTTIAEAVNGSVPIAGQMGASIAPEAIGYTNAMVNASGTPILTKAAALAPTAAGGLSKTAALAPTIAGGASQAAGALTPTAARPMAAETEQTVLKNLMNRMPNDLHTNPEAMTLFKNSMTAEELAVANKVFGTGGAGSGNGELMKGLIGAAGVTAVGGALSGVFQGQSASKQLALQKLINQQAYNQMQYKNKNNQYAPLVSFNRGGLVQQA